MPILRRFAVVGEGVLVATVGEHAGEELVQRPRVAQLVLGDRADRDVRGPRDREGLRRAPSREAGAGLAACRLRAPRPAARLASIGAGYAPLADLVEKLRREERYHRMHLLAWIDRLANGGPDARRRLEAALGELGPDASTVFTPLAGESVLLEAGILTRSVAEAEAAWRGDVSTILVPLGLPVPPHSEAGATGRQDHSDSFRWLWNEFTSVRRSEDGATW